MGGIAINAGAQVTREDGAPGLWGLSRLVIEPLKDASLSKIYSGDGRLCKRLPTAALAVLSHD